MAPEIIAGRPYNGHEVDLWAAVVCLFILYRKRYPFFKGAEKEDKCYKFIYGNSWKKFWGIHEKGKARKFAPDLKDLF